MAAVWEHVDEDGDSIQLIERAEPGEYIFEINAHYVVFIDEDALFRLRDVIEQISTS